MRPLLWLAYLCISLPLTVIGIPICAVLAYTRAWHEVDSPYFSKTVLAWRGGWLTWIFGNLEDGVTGPGWFHAEHQSKSDRWLAFIWSAWRNPTNNLRFVPLLSFVIDPDRIQFVGNADDPADHIDGYEPGQRVQWAYTWQGAYAGLVWRWQITPERHAQIRIGWKLLPRDRFGLPDWDFRRVRCPFGIQFHPWRKS